jgi:aminoglycoside 3'-phosphotransferase I
VALPPGLILPPGPWERVGGGESGGAVWRAGALYLKHGHGRIADDIADEFARLRWCAERFPVPKVVQFAAAGDEAWLVTTAMPGLTGDQWLEQGADVLPIAAAAGRFLRLIHALPAEECPFDASHPLRLAHAARNVTAGLVDEDDFDDDHEGWTAADVLAEARSLAPAERGRVVTHGDWSLGNLLLDDAGAVTGCIDLGRMGLADPYQDLAIMWQNLDEFGGEAQRAFLDAYGVGEVHERRLRFHRCLDELF